MKPSRNFCAVALLLAVDGSADVPSEHEGKGGHPVAPAESPVSKLAAETVALVLESILRTQGMIPEMARRLAEVAKKDECSNDSQAKKATHEQALKKIGGNKKEASFQADTDPKLGEILARITQKMELMGELAKGIAAEAAKAAKTSKMDNCPMETKVLKVNYEKHLEALKDRIESELATRRSTQTTQERRAAVSRWNEMHVDELLDLIHKADPKARRSDEVNGLVDKLRNEQDLAKRESLFNQLKEALPPAPARQP